MTITKKEFSAIDSAPSIIYAKHDGDSDKAFPVIASTFGGLVVNNGMAVPPHDQQVIDESDPDNVTITYKLGGVTKATKTISVVGNVTTITVA